jgi:hypothetical protein
MIFDTNSTERMKIRADGCLEFKSDAATNGEQRQRLEWWNENGAGIMAKISCIREATGYAPGALGFYTSANVDTANNSSEGSWYENMRIDSAGRTQLRQINFGYKTPSGGALRTDASFIHGGTSGSNMSYYSDEAAYWYTYSSGWQQRIQLRDDGVMVGDFSDTSDLALKENISDISGGLSIVKQLRPVNFDWKEDGKGTGIAGFVAQEVETILPKEVVGDDWAEPDEDGIGGSAGKAVNITGIVAHMAKAIQELEARIEILES